MKPFFVHRNNLHFRKHHPRGFTAYIQENPEDTRTVLMQVTFCSPKDQFCKKTGRLEAMKAKAEVINKRRVPEILAACNLLTVSNEPEDKGTMRFRSREYDYVLRFMV